MSVLRRRITELPIVESVDDVDDYAIGPVDGVASRIPRAMFEGPTGPTGPPASPGDALPNESGFWWVTEGQSIAGKVYVGTTSPGNSVWLQEWTESEDEGGWWLHRYFLGHVENAAAATADRDDHNSAGLAVAPGKPVVAFFSGHNVHPGLYYRISDQDADDCPPGEMTFGETQIFDTGAENRTAYSQVMFYGDDIWVCHRVGSTADRWAITKFPDWGTGTPVSQVIIDSTIQTYVKARIVGGSMRFIAADHPTMGGDNKLWWAEMDLTTEDITKADGTVLGNFDGTNLPLDNADLDLVYTSPGSAHPWGFDIGYQSQREIAFVDGASGTFTTTGEYRHAHWDGATWTTNDIALVGDFLGSYFPSIVFDPNAEASIIYATEAFGINYVWSAVSADDGATWTSTLIDQQNDSEKLLTRAYAVVPADGETPIFDVIGTEILDYPTYNGAWDMRVRPLPRTTVIRSRPLVEAPLVAGLRADLKKSRRPGSGVYFPGSSGAYISGPTTSVPSDGIRLEIDAALDSWASGGVQVLIAKEASTATRQVRFYVDGTGKVGVGWSADGTNLLTVIPNDLPPVTAGQRMQLRAEFMPAVPGSGGTTPTHYRLRTFYRFDDDTAWTALAEAQLTANSTIYAGSDAWALGGVWNATGSLAKGTFYRASIMTVAGEELARWTGDGGPNLVDAYGNTWAGRGTLGSGSATYTSAWDGVTPFKIGSYWHWYDSLGILWRKFNSAPASETDGTRILAQINSNTAAFASLVAGINTNDKYQGKMVYCTSHARPHWTNGSTAASVWLYSDGTTAHTPV